MALFEKKTIINTEIDYEKLADTIAKTKNIEIDYDKLAKSIINVSKCFEEKKETEEEEQRQNALKELRNKYKIQEEISGKGVSVFFKKIANNFKYIRAFLGYNEKQAAHPVMTFDLMRAISGLFFLIIEVIFIVLGGAIIFNASFYEKISDRTVYAFLGFFIVFLASFFRIPKLEVNVMKNKEMLITIFSVIMAFIAALFTVLSFVKEKI